MNVTCEEGRINSNRVLIVIHKSKDYCKPRVFIVQTQIIFLLRKKVCTFVSLFLSGKWTFCKLPPKGMAPRKRTVSRLVVMSKICKFKLKIFS